MNEGLDASKCLSSHMALGSMHLCMARFMLRESAHRANWSLADLYWRLALVIHEAVFG